jgi:hypothetical protein
MPEKPEKNLNVADLEFNARMCRPMRHRSVDCDYFWLILSSGLYLIEQNFALLG